MFIRRALALVVAILWLWPAGLYAQSETLMETFRQGKAFHESGQYEQAIVAFRNAVAISEREFGPDDPKTASLLSWLANAYSSQDRYGEAEPLHRRALAIRETALGTEHPNVASVRP